MRRLIGALINVAMALMLTGCASSTYYKEEFSSVMVSSDHKNFVVLGKDYHYVFDMPGMLQKSLNAEFRPHLTCAFIRDFYISDGGKTSGYFRLQLTDDAPPEAKKQALALGYTETKEGLVYFSSAVYGKRFKPTPVPKEGLTQLNRKYRVGVSDSQKQSDQFMLLSPVILLAGGAFAIANPATLLLAIPMTGAKP